MLEGSVFHQQNILFQCYKQIGNIFAYISKVSNFYNTQTFIPISLLTFMDEI